MATPSLTESLDSLWSSTWPHFKPGVIDAVFLKKYPLFWWLSNKGHLKLIDGGRDIRFPLEVDVNPTVTEIGRNGEVSLADVDPFTTVIYTWATVAGNINRYREDDLENRGKAQVFNLMEGKRKNLVKSMNKQHETYLFRARGTRPSYGLYSILDLIDDAPTGARTVGNIPQASYPWWRNVTRTASGVASVNMRSDLKELVYDLEDIESEPDIFMCHRDQFSVYEDDLLEMHIITNKALADAGFGHLVYKGIPMLKSPSASNTRVHALNTDYIYLVVHRAMNFEMTSWKEAIKQPFDRAAQIVVKEQFISTNRRAQGVLHTMTY